VALGTMKALAVGQPVYAISAPHGLGLTFTAGMISALRPYQGSYYIQTDAAISPGSSGGGLFDREGRLIGMPSFQLREGQNLNFALPVDWVVEIAQQAAQPAKSGAAPTTSQNDTASDWLDRTIALRAKKDWQGLLKLGQQWLKSEPENVVAWGTLGEAHSQLGQHSKALEARRKVVYVQPDNAEAWYSLGATYSDLGRPNEAREAFRKALQMRAQNLPGSLFVRLDDPNCEK
jgi:tetratricopeptide (TPR) repeat protein